MIRINFNERSWAIELISYLNQILQDSSRSIKYAGGEPSVLTGHGALFPDVVLYGDREAAMLLQGWELKLPDTSIDDYEFWDNARKKATALGLNSFVLWNVTYARLYTRHTDDSEFVLNYQWDDLAHITTRDAVSIHRQEWQHVAADMVDYVADLMDRGSLSGRRFVDAYRSGGITSLILENVPSVAEKIQVESHRSAPLRDSINSWWNLHKAEYGGNDLYGTLAKANLSNWIGKLMFAHVLQSRESRASEISRFGANSTPTEMLDWFEALSRISNFWTVFSRSLGLEILTDTAWHQLLELNHLLCDVRLASIDQGQLSDILEATAVQATRKLRGQYPTPAPLARLLIELAVNDYLDDRILDPCSGSGTIARLALEQKLQAGVSPEQAASLVYAGDTDPRAAQITTFALTKPSMMNLPVRVYLEDAFELQPDSVLRFRNPSTGVPFDEEMGLFDAIASNLPFVAQEGRERYSDAIDEITMMLGEPSLTRRADISAYLPFALHRLLKDSGRLAIIITNAWLSTSWGEAFFDQIARFYDLKVVVTSGAGRWFQNSKVVTNILVMNKRSTTEPNDESIRFVTLARPIGEIRSDEDARLIAAQIRQGFTHEDLIWVHETTRDKIERLRSFGLAGNAQFVNCEWVFSLPLVPARELFDIARGERRGWDPLFFPTQQHDIEPEYLRSFVKSPREIKGYLTRPKAVAFDCSASLDELRAHGHSGALAWIERFKHGRNLVNTPLPQVLARSGKHWYELGSNALAELVMPLNAGARIFVSRMMEPSYVNQRLTRFIAGPSTDTDLCHALLNTSIGMFMIEGMGFGRGEGAHDLNSTRVRNFLHLLDPNRLSQSQAEAIKTAFEPILNRDVMDVAEELDSPDRRHFDSVVLKAFSLDIPIDDVYKSLLHLVELRITATQTFE